MKTAKKIQKLLDRREKLAVDLMNISNQLDEWLEKHGADFTDPELADSTITGCRIYCEPKSAKNDVENYIKNKM